MGVVSLLLADTPQIQRIHCSIIEADIDRGWIKTIKKLQ